MNGIPTRFLSTAPFRDPSVSYLTNSTPNPFAGLATSQNGATISTAQLLARYPEFPVGDTASGWTGSGGADTSVRAGVSLWLPAAREARFSESCR